mgnify:CR=1 FL=1
MTSGEYQTRPARPADLAGVENLLRKASLPLDGLRDQFGEGYAIAESGGAIIGVEGIEVHGADRDRAPDGVRRSREFAEACPSSALFMRLPLTEETER